MSVIDLNIVQMTQKSGDGKILSIIGLNIVQMTQKRSLLIYDEAQFPQHRVDDLENEKATKK